MKIPTIVCAATLTLCVAPAFAQPAETCLTRTLAGQPISPAICFEPETISPAGEEAMEDVAEDTAPHAAIQPLPPITPPPAPPVQPIYD